MDRLKFEQYLLLFSPAFLSSFCLHKHIAIKTYITIILPVVLYGCETWSLTLRRIWAADVLELSSAENV